MFKTVKSLFSIVRNNISLRLKYNVVIRLVDSILQKRFKILIELEQRLKRSLL